MKKLSTFSLTLITICSVDSIRNLPAAALAGSQLFTYFTLALIFFLLPCAIIASWFSHQSSQGIYGWVKQGLGKRAGFIAIWFQCIQNILFYPTLLSFIAGILLFSIDPELADNKSLLFITVIILIWVLTWINLKGIQLSSRFNTFCSITGIFIPFTLILAMGLYWWLTQILPGESPLPPAVPYSWTSLTAIILSFCGIELTSVHCNESQVGAFRKAINLSVIIIFVSMLFGSITLSMIIPLQELNFISSIPQLIQMFFNKLQCGYLAPIINGLIALGCIGAANNWLIVPMKGLCFAANEGFMDTKYTQVNKNNVPYRLLIHQSIFVTILSSIFLIIPMINASYWILLNSGTQIMLLMYLLLFISAIKVATIDRIKKSVHILIASYVGIVGIGISLLVTLAAPPSLQFKSQITYALFGATFLIISILIPLWNVRNYNEIQEAINT